MKTKEKMEKSFKFIIPPQMELFMFDDDEKFVTEIRFMLYGDEWRGGSTDDICFEQPVSKREAVEAVETYFSQKATSDYFEKLREYFMESLEYEIDADDDGCEIAYLPADTWEEAVKMFGDEQGEFIRGDFLDRIVIQKLAIEGPRQAGLPEGFVLLVCDPDIKRT